MAATADELDGHVEVTAECGGVTIRILRKDLMEEGVLEANLFDEDFTVAAATGFTVWDGAWVLIEQLRTTLADTFDGKKVLELGSGTGLAGLCVAACGAHVCMTDITSVTEDMIKPNIVRNSRTTFQGDAPAASPWAGGLGIGVHGGTAAGAVLDWFRPLPEALDLSAVDYILASEVVWLQELVEPFVTTLHALLQLPCRPVAILVLRDRSKVTSKTFAKLAGVLEALTSRGCAIETLSTLRGPENEPACTIRVTLAA